MLSLLLCKRLCTHLMRIKLTTKILIACIEESLNSHVSFLLINQFFKKPFKQNTPNNDILLREVLIPNLRNDALSPCYFLLYNLNFYKYILHILIKSLLVLETLRFIFSVFLLHFKHMIAYFLFLLSFKYRSKFLDIFV